MAISFVGAGSKGAGTAAVTYALPSGTQNGDLLLLVMETANEPVTTPGEWLDVPSSPQGVGTAGSTSATRLKIMYRWVDGTTITTTVSDPGNHQVGGIVAFRGVDPNNPFNASAGVQKATSTTTCSFASVTTTVANCMVILSEAHALPDSNTSGQITTPTMASLTSVTEGFDYNSNSGNGGGCIVAYGIKATAGSTGTGSATHSTSSPDCTITLALAPAPEAQSLTPTRVDNSSTIYTPTVAVGAVALTQSSTATNTQTFYAPTVSAAGPLQSLTQDSTVSNTQTFYAPAVAAGAIALSAARLDNSQTFYAPTAAAGAVGLSPARLDNNQTFYAQTVAPGAVALTASRLDNSSALYAPTVEALAPSLHPPRLDNSQAFFGATVTPGAVELIPARLDNSSSVYAPTISAGGSSLAPQRLDNSQTFFGATVTPGAVALSPARLDNSSSVYAPTIEIQTSPGELLVPLVVNTSSIFPPALSFDQFIAPPLITQTSIFYPHRIGGASDAVLAGSPRRTRRQEEFINWVPEPAFDDAAARKAKRRRNELLLLN